MYEWPRLIQDMVDEIDRSILAHEEELLLMEVSPAQLIDIDTPEQLEKL